MRPWIGLLVLAACGPRLEATNARHVILEVESHELVDACEKPCARAVRPGERVVRCATSDAGWNLDPRFVGERSPPTEPEVFDMAKRFGPITEGYALCTIARAK